MNCTISASSRSFSSRGATGTYYVVRKVHMVTNAVARTHIKEVVLACEYLLCTNKVFYFEVLVLLPAFIQKHLVAQDKCVLAGCISICIF